MNRRTCIKVAAVFGAIPLFPSAVAHALPIERSPVPAPSLAPQPVEMEEVQYGEVLKCGGNASTTMPEGLRRALDRRAEALASKLQLPILKRDYFWLPSIDKGYLPVMAWGGMKWMTEVPKAARDAQFAAEGWRPYSGFPSELKGSRIELMDRWLKTGVVRYARVAR